MNALILLLIAAPAFALKDIPVDSNVNLVFVGFRHGNRNPGTFLADDPNKRKWGFEGEAMLTGIGKTQAFHLGTLLRERYDFMLSDQFDPDEFKATSSSADRCQMTTQACLAGLYPPEGWGVWDDDIKWQPISIEINDPLLRMYNINECQPQLDAWKVVDDGQTPEGQQLLHDNTELIDFVSSKTGWAKTLSKMADAADNLEGIHIRKLKLPDWVTFNNSFHRDILHDINKFAEAPQVLCAKYEPCRKLMAGYWMSQMIGEIEKKQTNKSKKKMFVYGSHNEIVTSLLWLMGIHKDGVYFNGAVVIEYREKPEKSVRVIYSAPKDDDPKERETEIVRPSFCHSDWCPFDQFKQGLASGLIADYKEACNIPVCKATTRRDAEITCRRSSECPSGQACVDENGGHGICRQLMAFRRRRERDFVDLEPEYNW